MRSIAGSNLTRLGSVMATALKSANPRHVDEFPWARHGPDRDLDQSRLTPRECLAQDGAQFIGAPRAPAGRSETLGILDEIRIGEVTGNQTIAELLLLGTTDIAKRPVDENERHKGDAM